MKVAILQARTNSSRLPGKVLLPVSGIPLSVLAAKRASNTGINVIVATSNEYSDDALATTLKINGLEFYRGSLENTLERIVNALDAYEDETLVFRLTADNVFPDGTLLEEIEKDLLKRGLQYICCNGIESGLPYGVSVELTYLKHLRLALKEANSVYDQEHVTPFIKRRFGNAYFRKYSSLKKGHYRCTVDCLDDYLVIQNVFSNVADPTNISTLDLVSLLEDQCYQPIQDSSVNKMTLGTAQLGLDYGVSNKKGKPSALVAEQILKVAIVNGVNSIDTASAYGNSEDVIGNALKAGWMSRTRVITKLSPLLDCPKDATISIVRNFVDASIFKSCRALQVQRLDTVLLHRASQIDGWDGAVWSRLLELRDNQVISRIGVSVQNSSELEHALNNLNVEYIQMPYNLLDWRWDNIIPTIRKVKKERELSINTRSSFLQGLLLSDNPEYWLKAHIENPEDITSWLEEQKRIHNLTSISELCLRFVAATDWIDSIVIGVETIEQLHENIKIMSKLDFNEFDMYSLLLNRPIIKEKSLDPACWR